MTYMDWFFANPKLFNFVIIGLYVLNAIWWAIHGKWADSLYWIGAIILTIGLTLK